MDKKNQGAARPWLLIALVGLVVLAFYKLNSVSSKPEELTVLEFLNAVDNQTATGKSLAEGALVRIVDRDSGTTRLEGEWTESEKTKNPSSGEEEPREKRTKFTVPLVPGENEKLMEDLQAREIKVKVKTVESAMSPFLMNILFFGGSIFLFYWLFARRMGGDGGPFGMGKSRAKMLTGKEEKKRATFTDVAGVDEAKEEVQEIVEFLKAPDGFRKLGGRIPKGVLLVGPPGTGKTLLARAIAGEAGVPFFAISGSDFEEMFVGVGASRMRDMFAEAKKRAPCIVFIDEIDSIGMKRTGAGAIGGSHAYEQTLNTMLVEMDGFDANEGVIVIAATNRPDTLDAALLRPGRFDRQVVVELPTLKGREEILALHGKKIKFGPDADLKRVARGTPGFSGADLANLLNEAALMAVRKKLDAVDMATLDEARDKILWGRERKSAGYSQNDREITAWHESGHALLQLLLKNTDPLHKVTIIPRGRALGATMSLPEKDVLNRTKSHFLDELVVMCGGRIAEKLFTGELSTGAAMDIAQATDTARKMVCTYGMSERFGFQAFKEQGAFTVAELPPAFSEETSRAIDAEVSRLISDAYAKAEKLIGENRDRLETLAKALLEKETMDGRDVEELLGLAKEKTENPPDAESQKGEP
ncbi:MAG: ATP-dependent zinc metalloprotease FtsH [Kiritimatiellae bacterium]|nr:ATP-dependent zinc metalloprotease FtsH [Kiritimatiellia bacterium]